MQCPNCGSYVSDKAKFCTECGMRMPQTQQHTTSVPPTTPPDPTPGERYYADDPAPKQNPTQQGQGSYAWAILGFFFPFVGVILAIIWRVTKPKSSRGVAIGAAASIVLSVFTSVAVSLFSGEPTDTSGPTTEQTATSPSTDVIEDEKQGDAESDTKEPKHTVQATSGAWGTCEWEIDEDGALVVYPGSGDEAWEGIPWSSHAEDITSIRCEKGVVLPESCSSLFGNLPNLKTADLSGCDFSQASNLHGLFEECAALKSVDFGNPDMSNVRFMSSMFFRCTSLKSVDTSNWDTSNVENMLYLFLHCESLKTVDVSHWDTSKVENMDGVFEGCTALKELDVSKWDTSSVEEMECLFQYCESLKALDVSKWDTSHVQEMWRMFDSCSSLKELDVSGFDVSRVRSMSGMFAGCENISELDVSKWNTSSLEDTTQMFFGCSSLKKLDTSGWDTSHITESDDMFYGCTLLDRVSLDK